MAAEDKQTEAVLKFTSCRAAARILDDLSTGIGEILSSDTYKDVSEDAKQPLGASLRYLYEAMYALNKQEAALLAEILGTEEGQQTGGEG